MPQVLSVEDLHILAVRKAILAEASCISKDLEERRISEKVIVEIRNRKKQGKMVNDLCFWPGVWMCSSHTSAKELGALPNSAIRDKDSIGFWNAMKQEKMSLIIAVYDRGKRKARLTIMWGTTSGEVMEYDVVGAGPGTFELKNKNLVARC